MKTRTQIIELTHEDLVNLLCTATYGSEWLGIKIPKGNYKGTPLEDENDCVEDRWAKVLLNNGSKVFALDYLAEGEYYGTLPHKVANNNGTMRYDLTLRTIKEGLSKAADSTDEYLRTCFTNFATDDPAFDLAQADYLMQFILFDDVIYG